MVTRALTSDDLVAWLRWADAGTSSSERERRGQKVRDYLFPDGLDFVERSRREAIVVYVEKLFENGDPPSWDGYPEPREPGALDPEQPVSQPPRLPPPFPEWEGFISPGSRAYRRASLHDGTAAEIDRMRERSRGSPFFADGGDVKRRPKR